MMTYIRHGAINALLFFMVAIASLFSLSAQAAIIEFHFPLEGSQEVPPSVSAGSGSCGVNLDDVSGAVSANCTFSGLSSNAVASHIHGLAPPGVNAAAIITMDATPSTSGTVTGNGILSPDQVIGMLDGLTYINVHTESDPGGEIRGQVVGRVAPMRPDASPIPSTSRVFLIVLGGLIFVLGGIALGRRSP